VASSRSASFEGRGAAVIAGAIFSYYLLDLRRGEDGKNVDAADKLGRPLAIAAILVGVAQPSRLPFHVMGTPVEQRRVRIDAGRVDDSSKIADAVREYRQEHGHVPPDLAALANKPGVALRVQDREGQGSTNTRRGCERFRLCARFTTDTACNRPRSIRDLPTVGAWRRQAMLHAEQTPGDDGDPCQPRRPLTSALLADRLDLPVAHFDAEGLAVADTTPRFR
jgi:hypothetical protein